MFITNRNNANENSAEEASMSARLRNIIPATETLSILSGYFYFNGIPPLVEPIAANENLKLRILVGLDVDKKGYELAHAGDGDSAQERFRNSLRNYATSGLFDSERCALSMETFLRMIDEGRLEIRKTAEPNHAKLYIFEMTATVAQATEPIRWITGSSNLTYPGLNNQNEFNVELSNFGGNEVKQYFDELWNPAEQITEFTGMTQDIRRILMDESVHATVTPYEAYALVLKNYLEHRSLVDETPRIDWAFALPQDPITHQPKYRPYSYQKDAVNQACSIIREYNGVIVADVVGLGKSVIGSVLGCVIGARRGIVIAPPGLVGDKVEGTGWWGYLQDFKLDLHGWEVWSRGSMDKIAEYVARHEDFDTVIVDEAHYFRNEDSIDYDFLWRVCQGRRVVLMTATPYSNRPSDMFALLKLFTVPRQSNLVPGGDLEAAFDKLQRRYADCDYVLKNVRSRDNEPTKERERRVRNVRTRLNRLGEAWLEGLAFNVPEIESKMRRILEGIAAHIRMIMEPVMIRRNRIDLKNDPQYREEIGANLPTVHSPEEQFYHLSPAQSEFYGRVIETYFGKESTFHGAIYRPGRYANVTSDEENEDDEESGETSEANAVNLQQENMYKFIRRLLVHRFESSFGAFAKTVKNLIEIHEKVRKLAQSREHGVVILDRAVMERFYAMNREPSDEMFEQTLAMYERRVSNESDKQQVYRTDVDFTQEGYEKFMSDLNADLNLFKHIEREIGELDLIANDPKATQLCTIIERVFSGNAGFQHHAGEPRRKVLVFSEFADTVEHVAAYLTRAFPNRVSVVRTLNRKTVEEVRYNFDGTVDNGLQQNQLDVMIATDKMSEGFNLNRAGLVINYDIPWNPTRVIQRIGRINRIGTKIFGDLYLYNYFPTDQGSEHYNIRTVAENKILMIHKAIGEDARIFSESEEPTASGLFAKLAENPDDAEAMTFLTECRVAYAEIRAQHPEVIEKIGRLPHRVKTATNGQKAGTHLFTRKGLTLFVSFMGVHDDEPTYELMKDALEYVKCPYEQPRNEAFSDGFWARYSTLVKASGEHVERCAQGNRSLARNAIRVLTYAEQNGIETQFAGKLARNIRQCGTLPDHVLRSIDAANRRGPQDLQAYLLELKAALGENVLPDTTASGDDAVIVAIDHA